MVHDTSTPPAAALDFRTLLRTPRGPLTDHQVRGITCVWCGIALTPATAINLGERTRRHLDGRLRWWPRGCLSCAQLAALRALHVHVLRCPECETDYRDCLVGHGLIRLLMRECRR